MKIRDNKKTNHCILAKSFTGKITVLAIILVLMSTALSAANIQIPETIPPQKNEVLSITWDVTMNFNEPGGKTDYVMFGEAADANDGPPADTYDVVKPPAPIAPYIRAYLDDKLSIPYNNLWMDYREYPDTDKIWNLTIRWEPEDGESSTTITISWSTAEVDDSEYTTVNLCTTTGTVLKNMLVDTTYTFSCPALTPQNFKIICSDVGNNHPVFGTPFPVNGSTGNLLSLVWNISINDPEGDVFSWTIQCSNGQTNSETSATNGTKSLSLSGLTYSTTYKIWVNATDPSGSGLYTRKWYTFTTQQQNLPPNKPDKPTGTSSGKINTVYTYRTSTTDPNGDQVYYLWDWGDGTQSSWLGPNNSGSTIKTTHTWNVKGSYSIKVKAKDISGVESDWSDPLPIAMPYMYKPLWLFLKSLFERFPHIFPILRQLFRY